MTTPTETPAKPVTITFRDRIMPVQDVSAEQMALLIEAQEWFRRRRRDIEAIAQGADLDSDPELTARAEQMRVQGFKHVGRMQTILEALFVEDDWDFICDGMATKAIKWTEVADLPAEILKAYRFANEGGEPANREERRSAAKRGRRAA